MQPRVDLLVVNLLCPLVKSQKVSAEVAGRGSCTEMRNKYFEIEIFVLFLFRKRYVFIHPT